LPCAVAVVEMATSNELVDRLGVQTASLGLDDRALVPVQPEPRQGAIDPLGPLVAVALGVGVLDAQQERTALLTGEEPVEQGRAGRPRPRARTPCRPDHAPPPPVSPCRRP